MNTTELLRRRAIFFVVGLLVFFGLSWLRHKNLNTLEFSVASVGAIALLSVTSIRSVSFLSLNHLLGVLLSSFAAGVLLALVFLLAKWPWKDTASVDALELLAFVAVISLLSGLWLACTAGYIAAMWNTKNRKKTK